MKKTRVSRLVLHKETLAVASGQGGGPASGLKETCGYLTCLDSQEISCACSFDILAC